MDEEEHHVEVQREASSAGLLAFILFLFLLVMGVISGIVFWPAIHLTSTPPPLRRCPSKVGGKESTP